MTLHLEYITDVTGKHKAVVIPNKEWQQYTKEYEKLKKKLSILMGVNEAMKEVRSVQAGKKKVKPFSEFLDEL